LKEKDLTVDFTYSVASQNEEKRFFMKKKKDEDNINLILQIQKSGEKPHEIKSNMDLADFIVFQELIRFSLPYVMGWHILDSPRIAEEEYGGSGSDNQVY